MLIREVDEEVGLKVKNIKYLTSMSYVRSDNIPTIIVSLFADHHEGDVKLCNALTEHAWVSLDEAKNYALIDGIYEDPNIYNQPKIVSNFAKLLHEDIFSLVKETPGGHDEITVKSKFLEFDDAGNQIFDIATGEPIIRVSPETLNLIPSDTKLISLCISTGPCPPALYCGSERVETPG